MRYQDPVTGEWKTISVKAADTLPIGTIVDYDGDTVPDGWEEVPQPGSYIVYELAQNLNWSAQSAWGAFPFTNISRSSGDSFTQLLTQSGQANKFKVTSNVKKIRVSAQLAFQKALTVYWLMASINVNGNAKQVNIVGSQSNTGTAADWYNLKIDAIVDVEKDDIIDVSVFKDSAGNILFPTLTDFKGISVNNVLFEVIE